MLAISLEHCTWHGPQHDTAWASAWHGMSPSITCVSHGSAATRRSAHARQPCRAHRRASSSSDHEAHMLQQGTALHVACATVSVHSCHHGGWPAAEKRNWRQAAAANSSHPPVPPRSLPVRPPMAWGIGPVPEPLRLMPAAEGWAHHDEVLVWSATGCLWTTARAPGAAAQPKPAHLPHQSGACCARFQRHAAQTGGCTGCTRHGVRHALKSTICLVGSCCPRRSAGGGGGGGCLHTRRRPLTPYPAAKRLAGQYPPPR